MDDIVAQWLLPIALVIPVSVALFVLGSWLDRAPRGDAVDQDGASTLHRGDTVPADLPVHAAPAPERRVDHPVTH